MSEDKIETTENFTINSDMAANLMITVPEYNNLVFNCGDGKEVVLTLKGGKLELSGNGDMNKAAKDFFECLLKPIVDTYVESMSR